MYKQGSLIAGIFILSWGVPSILAQDAVNPCEILSESINCTAPGMHGAEIDFKTIKLNGKRKTDPMANVGDALVVSTGIRYTKRAKLELTTTFNGGCPPRTETKRIKPDVNVTYTATLNGSSYSGSGAEFTLTAPLAIGSYPLIVNFTAAAANGCIDNAPITTSKTFLLDVIDGAYILNLTAQKTGSGIPVAEGTYLCKDQGQQLDFNVTFSDPLANLPFNANDIVWTVSPPDAGTFTGPNGANGDTVTWSQADDFVSTLEDDLVITVNAPDMQPRSFALTVFGINSTSGILPINSTVTFPIENSSIYPTDADKSIIVAALGGITDVGTGTATKLRTRSFTGASPFGQLESEIFLPAEVDQTNPALQIIKKATFMLSGSDLVVEIQSGPVADDVNITWEQDRPGGTRQILHREHMTVIEDPGPQTVKIFVDGTMDEGPYYVAAGSNVKLKAVPDPASFAFGYPIWSLNHNTPGTLAPPSDGSEFFEFTNLLPGAYEIKAKVGNKSIQKATFKLHVVQADLDVDTNRNGIVEDAADDTDEALWTSASGAIFAVNYDDDNGSLGGRKSDSIEFAANGTPINEDTNINFFGDVDDVAPLFIRKAGSTEGVQYFLRIDGEQLRGIHIFKKRNAGASLLKDASGDFWSGWDAHSTETGPQSIEITDLVKDQADIELGVEGLFFPGFTVFDHVVPGMPTADWTYDGTVDIELIVQKDVGSPTISAPDQLAIDTVKMRVAPYMLLPNTQDALDVYLENDPGTLDIRAKFGSLSRPTSTTEGQWLQDHVQIGFTGFPGSTSHITLRMPYGGQDAWPEQKLLGSGKGLFRMRDFIANPPPGSSSTFGSGEFGGNLELIPFSEDWPMGRILLGNIMSTEFQDFFKAQKMGGAQAVQEPIEVDSSWLVVGHVDEFMGFAKGGPHGFKVIHGDPKLAHNLLDSMTSAEKQQPLFSTDVHISGQATNQTAFSPIDHDFLFDGAAHGYLNIVNKSNVSEGQTLTLKDGTHTVVLEFDTDTVVASGHVLVSLTGISNETQLRDLILAKINTEIGLGNLDFITFEDDLTGIILINDNLTSAGNLAITKTVPNSGITKVGMMGGQDPGGMTMNSEGRDFTSSASGKPWKWVRIISGTGAGQIAMVEPGGYGKGWLKLDKTGSSFFYTTSNLIWSPGSMVQGFYMFASRLYVVPSGTTWFGAPDATSEYIVVTECREWRAIPTTSGSMNFPALWSVKEYLAESATGEEMDVFNTEVETVINSAITAVETGMGLESGGPNNFLKRDFDTTDDSLTGDSDDDFVSVPIIFFGLHNDPLGSEGFGSHAGLVPRHTIAYTPGLANFQPAHQDLIVFPKPFMPKVTPSGSSTQVDVFEKAVEDVMDPGNVGRVKFADDWDLFHRLDGEVHCGTAARRTHLSMPWWELIP